MKFLQSYVPFLLALVCGILFYDHSFGIVHWILPLVLLSVFFLVRQWTFFILALIFVFYAGIFLRQFRENEFLNTEKQISPYLDKKIILEGEVVSHPIPSTHKISYVVETKEIHLNGKISSERYRIQINSKSYQSPEKGDIVRLKTKLYTPSSFQNFQKIKQIHAYAAVFGDGNWELISKADLTSTRIRKKIFLAAQTHLSPLSYGYFRAMVFGDQAFLNEATMTRLKETGLLHLFVISGYHISFVWGIGFFMFRIFLSWIGIFHRRRDFFLWIESGSILSVFIFLEWINPPVSTVRAVGTMILFLLLKVIRRHQNPLWNLGVVFMAVLLFNPLYLFDVSTQLTFASVAGIFCICQWVNQKVEMNEMNFASSHLMKAGLATLGAGLFTFPILYFQFGTFYPISFLYNLVIVPTIGALVSCLSVASLVWPLIPIESLHRVGFGILDFLFIAMEKILFFQVDFYEISTWEPYFMGISGLYWLFGLGTTGMALIIARRFSKESLN